MAFRRSAVRSRLAPPMNRIAASAGAPASRVRLGRVPSLAGVASSLSDSVFETLEAHPQDFYDGVPTVLVALSKSSTFTE